MVASGLAVRVSVAHERLAFHLTLACMIYAALIWTLQGLRTPAPFIAPSNIRISAIGLLILVFAELYLGALVAGLRGGLIYNTWPLIDGALVPVADRLMFLQPFWRNFFDNVLTVQFEHRMLAYGLWLLSLAHVAHVALRAGGAALTGALALSAAITIQAGLGILTLVYQTPLALALLHQGMAMIVLTIAVVHAGRLMPNTAEARATALSSV
jgi:cytochrome c oxidase assembly protein subunit 15